MATAATKFHIHTRPAQLGEKQRKAKKKAGKKLAI